MTRWLHSRYICIKSYSQLHISLSDNTGAACAWRMHALHMSICSPNTTIQPHSAQYPWPGSHGRPHLQSPVLAIAHQPQHSEGQLHVGRVLEPQLIRVSTLAFSILSCCLLCLLSLLRLKGWGQRTAMLDRCYMMLVLMHWYIITKWDLTTG